MIVDLGLVRVCFYGGDDVGTGGRLPRGLESVGDSIWYKQGIKEEITLTWNLGEGRQLRHLDHGCPRSRNRVSIFVSALE